MQKNTYIKISLTPDRVVIFIGRPAVCSSTPPIFISLQSNEKKCLQQHPLCFEGKCAERKDHYVTSLANALFMGQVNFMSYREELVESFTHFSKIKYQSSYDKNKSWAL